MTPLVRVANLTKQFIQGGGKTVHALNGVSFDIFPGEILGLVGESGCGKSTVARAIVRLIEITSGQIFFEKAPIFSLGKKELKNFRRQVGMIFQDPYASLNPRMTVESILGEPFEIHKLCRGSEKRKQILSLLSLVGLPSDSLFRFPHEFSGGQKQRIGIARALAPNPRLIICDEPLSALDVSVQAQIINLLKQLKEHIGLTLLFIAHDLRVVKYLSDRIAVMYLGHIVELAQSEKLYAAPMHPYTQALLSAIPIPDPKIERSRKRIVLQGEQPSATNPPRGCPFSTRCPIAKPICHDTNPPLVNIATSQNPHYVACHLCKPQTKAPSLPTKHVLSVVKNNF